MDGPDPFIWLAGDSAQRPRRQIARIIHEFNSPSLVYGFHSELPAIDRRHEYEAQSDHTSRVDDAAELRTAPELLLHHAAVRGDKTAMREKEYGIWQSWTWSQMKEEILALANGLASIGFKRGDKLGIIGANRPQLYWGMCAAQCLGGIPVPLYKDMVAEELQYVLEHAGIQFMLAEDQEQVDKVMEVQAKCPALEQIIYDDERGMRDYDHTHLHSIKHMQDAGREFAKNNTDFVRQEIDRNNGSDVGIFLYTSGTTGKPKAWRPA